MINEQGNLRIVRFIVRGVRLCAWVTFRSAGIGTMNELFELLELLVL